MKKCPRDPNESYPDDFVTCPIHGVTLIPWIEREGKPPVPGWVWGLGGVVIGILIIGLAVVVVLSKTLNKPESAEKSVAMENNPPKVGLDMTLTQQGLTQQAASTGLAMTSNAIQNSQIAMTRSAAEAQAQQVTETKLIAYYELRDNANDSTGSFSQMTLENVPFRDNGAYCNGVYQYGGGENYCLMLTPQLESFDYNSFSISAKFKVTNFNKMPVFVGGDSYRWIGYYLRSDGGVSLLYNNENDFECEGNYNVNNWHEALLTYDGIEGKLYLDGVLGCSVQFMLDQGNDKNIGTTHFGSGEVFMGLISDLKVYNGVIKP